MELPWAAEKVVQQLGRTHRSNQVTAPVYKMVVTDLGGERRFAAAVAKRMANLGALTKGDRRAASGSDMGEFDVDSKFGKRSLKRFYSSMADEPPSLPSRGTNACLDTFLEMAAAAASPAFRTDDGKETTTPRPTREFALRVAKKALGEIGILESGDTSADLKVLHPDPDPNPNPTPLTLALHP